MCWQGKNVPLIADKEINVFKLVLVNEDGVITSVYHRNHIWKLGKIYTTSVKGTPIGNHEARVYKGFHCYSVKDVFLELVDANKIIHVRHLFKNLDSFWRQDRTYGYHVSVMECTIPKGALYYKNEYGEIVTDRICPNTVEDEPKHLIFKMK